MSACRPRRGQRRRLVDRAVHFLDRDERRHADTHDAGGIAHQRHGGRRRRVGIVGDDDGVVLAIGEIEGFDLAARRLEPLSWRSSRTPSAFKVTLARNFGMATSLQLLRTSPCYAALPGLGSDPWRLAAGFSADEAPRSFACSARRLKPILIWLGSLRTLRMPAFHPLCDSPPNSMEQLKSRLRSARAFTVMSNLPRLRWPLTRYPLQARQVREHVDTSKQRLRH